MFLRIAALCLFGLALAPHASAQDAPAERPAFRGTHARGLVALHGAIGIVTSDRGILVGGGATVGLDVAFHPNHDIGLRASLTVNGLYRARPVDSPHLWGLFFVSYRFHDDVTVERVAPFLQLGVGVGVYGGCLAGDLCGGLGAAFEAAGGIEYALDPAFALVFGAQLLFQTGLANGVALLLAPTVFAGFRFG